MDVTWDKMKERIIKNPLVQTVAGLALVVGLASSPPKTPLTIPTTQSAVDLSKCPKEWRDPKTWSEYADQVSARKELYQLPARDDCSETSTSPQQLTKDAGPPIPANQWKEYEARARAIQAEIKTADKQKFFDDVQLARAVPGNQFIAGNRLFAIYDAYKKSRHVTTAAEETEISQDFAEATGQSYDMFLQEYRGIAKQTFASAKGVMNTLSKKEGEFSSDERKRLAGCALAFTFATESLKATGDLTKKKAEDFSVLGTAALNRSGIEISGSDQAINLAQTCP